MFNRILGNALPTGFVSGVSIGGCTGIGGGGSGIEAAVSYIKSYGTF